MASLFIDTNVFLDQIFNRSSAHDVRGFFLFCIEQNQKLVTSISCIQTILYMLEKEKVKKNDQRETIVKIIELVDLVPTSKACITTAMHSNFKDLEDAILYFTAVENMCGAFVTQNVRDFPRPHPVRVCTPVEFLKDAYENN
jgi:predicted nucleic acid-binding protein